MKKIKLKVEDLAVTSMEMEEIATGTGTIRAAAGSDWDCITHSCQNFCLPWWLTGTCG